MSNDDVTLQLISDVHLEFHRDGGRGFVEDLDPAGADVIVVAGDFATAPLLAPRLTQLCGRYPDVVFVAGNHELYGSSPLEIETLLGGLDDELPNLHWLHRNRVSVQGVMFAGATLWFADQPGNAPLSAQLADFEHIHDFVPWVYEENRRDVAFLRRSAPAADVVVTHHLPSPRCVHPRYAGSPINRFFVCDVEDVITDAPTRSAPRLWLHGHTHESVDIQIAATRIVANPFGYRGHALNPAYSPRLLLKVTPEEPGAVH